MTGDPLAALEQRVERIEKVLGLPWLHFDYWIVQREQGRDGASLAYWGPYETPEAASADTMYRPQFGCRILEFPR